MRLRILGPIVSLLLTVAVPAGSKPPAHVCEATALATAMQAVAAVCPCDTAANHGQYVSCAVGVIRQQLKSAALSWDCRRPVLSAVVHSTCGKPNFVTCCRTRGQASTCSIRRTAAGCVATGGCVGATTSCMDACTAGCGSPSGAFLDDPSLF
jgi:hypothetical protein